MVLPSAVATGTGSVVAAASWSVSTVRASAAGRVPWVVRLRARVGGLPAGSVVGTSSYLDASPIDAALPLDAGPPPDALLPGH